MGDNNLLFNTTFNFVGRHKLSLFVAKQDDFSFYYSMRPREGADSAEAKPWKADWSRLTAALPRPMTHKSIDQYLAEFDYSLTSHCNSFSVHKYRFQGLFPEDVRLKLIATDLKSRLHAVSTSSEAGKHMSRRFTFYDIAKLENLDLESKKTLLFGKKIGDAAETKNGGMSVAPVVSSLADIPEAHFSAEKRKPSVQEVANAQDQATDGIKEEIFLSGFKERPLDLIREEYLLSSPPLNLPPPRYFGVIKVFFDDDKYGFFASKDFGGDVYVALEELKKAGVSKKIVRKHREQVYSFAIQEYTRKNKAARKAIDVRMEPKP